MDKLEVINKAFFVLDKPKSGMKDSSLDQSIPIYIFDFYDEYIENLLTDVNAYEVGKKISFGTLQANYGTNGTIRTFNEVDYKSVRGLARFMPGKIIKHDVIVFSKGKRVGITNVYGTSNGKEYRLLSKNRVSDSWDSEKRDSVNFEKIISPMLWLDFASDYIDIIEIKNKNACIRIPSHPDASKELLKLREIPEGMKRRPALINWVSEHSRQCRTVETSVKKHLRGKTEIDWMEYKVTIYKNT